MTQNIQTVIEKLCQLQNLDRDLGQAERIFKENPQKVEELERKNRQEQEKLEVEKERLKLLEKEQRGKESDLKYREDKTKRIEARIRTIRSGKEYQALLRETALAKKENSELEEGILRSWEELEQLKLAIESGEEAQKEGEIQAQAEIERLRREVEGVESRIQELRERRQQMVEGLEEELLQRYQRIRDRVSWMAVTEVKEGICQGCYVNIPPQLYNEIIRNDSIHQCPSCQRILFYNGREQNEKVSESS